MYQIILTKISHYGGIVKFLLSSPFLRFFWGIRLIATLSIDYQLSISA